MTYGNKTIFASQTVEGCEGAKGPVSYVINSKPENPVVTEKFV
jgi:hypothetical protein